MRPTGFPIKPEFVPCRFTGAATDSLLLVNGTELLIFAPGD